MYLWRKGLLKPKYSGCIAVIVWPCFKSRDLLKRQEYNLRGRAGASNDELTKRPFLSAWSVPNSLGQFVLSREAVQGDRICFSSEQGSSRKLWPGFRPYLFFVSC